MIKWLTKFSTRSNDFRVYELLADCYSLLGLPEHATEQLSRASNLPKVPPALFKKLGLMYQGLGNQMKYVRCFSEFFTKQIEMAAGSNLEIVDESEFEAASAIIKDPSAFDQNNLKILAAAVFKYPSKKVSAS